MLLKEAPYPVAGAYYFYLYCIYYNAVGDVYFILSGDGVDACYLAGVGMTLLVLLLVNIVFLIVSSGDEIVTTSCCFINAAYPGVFDDP